MQKALTLITKCYRKFFHVKFSATKLFVVWKIKVKFVVFALILMVKTSVLMRKQEYFRKSIFIFETPIKND